MGQALQWGFLKSLWGEGWVVEAGPSLQSFRAQAPATGLLILDAAAYHFLERAVWSAQGQGALCGAHSVECSGPCHAPWGCPCLPSAHPPEHVRVSVRSGSYQRIIPKDRAGVDFALADMPVLCPTQAATGTGTRTGAPAVSAAGTEPSQPTMAPSVEAVGLPGCPGFLLTAPAVGETVGVAVCVPTLPQSHCPLGEQPRDPLFSSPLAHLGQLCGEGCSTPSAPCLRISGLRSPQGARGCPCGLHAHRLPTALLSYSRWPGCAIPHEQKLRDPRATTSW